MAAVNAFWALGGGKWEEWSLRHKGSVWLPVLPEDWRNGDPRNPAKCALALAEERVLGPGAAALFYRSVAYVYFPQEGRIYRFRLRAATMRVIDRFDRTRRWPKGVAGVELHGATKSQTLKAKRERAQEPPAKPGSRKVRNRNPHPVVRGAYSRNLPKGKAA